MTLTLALTAGNAVSGSETKLSVTVIDLSDEKVSCNERHQYLSKKAKKNDNFNLIGS